MSITQNDFKKIWASTSSVPEYTFSDADYQDGWEFVGNLPPTRAMWDTLQRRNDQKMKFLQDNGSMCFDSVADMVSTDLDEGQTVFTKGYYSVNDGGSAIYTIRAKEISDVEDGGSIIFLDNGNVAELIKRDTVNVKQFGAYGDGTHDDTDSIQAVFGSGYKTIVFPHGTYIIADTINVPSNIYIYGDGSTVKVQDQNRISGAMFLIDHQSNVIFDGLIFDENMSNMPVYDDITLVTSYNIAIVFTYSRNLIVKNCRFINLYNLSISLSASTGVIDISDNVFKSLVQPQGYMANHISMTNITVSSAITIRNNDILNDDYTNSAYGVCAIEANNVTNGNLLIENNRLINCGRDIHFTHRLHPIDFYTNVSNAIIRGNYIKSRYGCTRFDACENIIFENNTVDIELPATTDLAGDSAFWIVAGNKTELVPNNITIHNNVFNMASMHYSLITIYNAKTNVAQTEHIKNIRITNNVFNSAGISNYFVVMDYCVQNILIANNTVDANAINIGLWGQTVTDQSVVTAENITIKNNVLYSSARNIAFNALTNKSVKNVVICDNTIRCANAYGIVTDHPIRVFDNYLETAVSCKSTTEYSFGYDNVFYNALGGQGEVDFLGAMVVKHDNYKVNGTKID